MWRLNLFHIWCSYAVGHQDHDHYGYVLHRGAAWRRCFRGMNEANGWAKDVYPVICSSPRRMVLTLPDVWSIRRMSGMRSNFVRSKTHIQEVCLYNPYARARVCCPNFLTLRTDHPVRNFRMAGYAFLFNCSTTILNTHACYVIAVPAGATFGWLWIYVSWTANAEVLP